MPAQIDADLYSQISHFASSRDRRAMVVKAILDGTYFGALDLGKGPQPSVKTSGNVFPMLLSAKTLVAKLSTDGGSTWGAARTHTFPTSLKSELDLGTLGDLDTVVEAHLGGTDGDDITVAAVGDSPGAGGVTISRVGSALTIHYESGVSTVAQVEAAIAALTGADDIVDVKTAGTGATVLTAPDDDFAATNLADGTDDGLFADADAVVADIEADGTFLGTEIAVSADGDELVLTYDDTGSNLAIKVDATSTGIEAQTADTLQYTNNQTGTGAAGFTIQVKDQAQQPLSGVKDVLVRLLPVTGSPTLTIGSKGAIKLGSGTAEVWAQTDATGALELILTGTTASDVLVIVQTDNGEVETTKITLPL
jgi:hypothetical protein